MSKTVDRDKARVLRGLSLFRLRGREIEHTGGEAYTVPASEPGRRYHVHLGLNGGCTCPDFQMRLAKGVDVGPCKHIYAVAIYRAKMAGKTINGAAA